MTISTWNDGFYNRKHACQPTSKVHNYKNSAVNHDCVLSFKNRESQLCKIKYWFCSYWYTYFTRYSFCNKKTFFLKLHILGMWWNNVRT